MEGHRLVLPEHLNHFGYLFGGNMLKWVDEFAWMAATLDWPGSNFVTIGMDEVKFKKSVRQGTILKFVVDRTKVGQTSVAYKVTVVRKDTGHGDEEAVFSTNVTLVHVDSVGQKQPLPRGGQYLEKSE
jgi:acyl-CoA hydrolase